MTDLNLPPLLNPLEVVEPFETAIRRIRERRSGAGDVFWTAASPTQADFAIVLEPDVSHHNAIEMIPLALIALSDCLAVLLPPQVAVQFRDEQFVTVNAGVAGGVVAAMAKQTAGSDVPDWLVLSVKLGMQRQDDAGDPGLQPDITTLDEEGWQEPGVGEVIETFSRHFLSWMAVWNDDGFEPIVRAWKFRAENETEPDMIAVMKNIKMFESGRSQ